MIQENMKGNIKTVDSRGIGFITTAKHIDFFFHYTAFNEGKGWKKLVAHYVNNPSAYLEVVFDVDKTATEGPRAINVRLVKDL